MITSLFSGTLVSEVIIVAIIALVIFIIFKLGKGILKLLFGIIANSILGLIAIFLLNYVLNPPIQLHIYVIIAVALFGLPAVGTLVILNFFHVLMVAII